VPIVDRVEAAGVAAPIEEAKVIVAGGRGVGGPDGFGVVRDSRMRSAVPWARPGQRSIRAGSRTPSRSADREDREAGPLSRPRISRRDPAQGRDADGGHDRRRQSRPRRPIAEFADLVVIGDLFEVAPRSSRAPRSGG